MNAELLLFYANHIFTSFYLVYWLNHICLINYFYYFVIGVYFQLYLVIECFSKYHFFSTSSLKVLLSFTIYRVSVLDWYCKISNRDYTAKWLLLYSESFLVDTVFKWFLSTLFNRGQIISIYYWIILNNISRVINLFYSKIYRRKEFIYYSNLLIFNLKPFDW